MNLIQTQMAASAAVHNALYTITYAIGQSAIGKILAARSQVGVCAILIGDDAEALEQNLADRFPGNMLVEDKATLRDDLAAIVRFIETPGGGLDLPLDMRHGTPFQQRVWDALRSIPCGATITYTALARRLGQPNGARAVATACAANAIALGIPCHRVVRADGTLSGYRWGVERKRALIDKEATI
ncbi:methylated-DNA--[protein]-cysteine S-methyltransferase [Mesorhizobium sp. M7A.F.Ca.US.006.01.1.1]|uniref:methylated-DNA--[protein]-cysteine S-methyltransferase n=1 Tax=Mesorhizobium sp. M7A.F.Ca.US.006.01.1.1 TaxID=2496707 RepID=UPI000FCB8E9F|nr:methylated-DNA--[protein]-cysteine S-methyltransferase [Mesorhizobium sp. M7A.F.Ca.US.006.01.1.1]RUZ72966.1 methylated-DNA--[protein]-cysteine S-methyltransferase [Mesorhizobium sp. M7A.F.Ca.US.006.01.1.1]